MSVIWTEECYGKNHIFAARLVVNKCKVRLNAIIIAIVNMMNNHAGICGMVA